MVAVVSGSGLGLFGSSVTGLGGAGASGNASLGRGGERVYVNTATGNLIVQSQDEVLRALGLDLALIRTYNSQGLLDDDNGDNWRLSAHQRVFMLSGTPNTSGSTIAKVFGDGREVLYTYDDTLSLYVSTEGDGAHDTLSYNSSTTQWTWTEGSARISETYDGSGRLLTSTDADGNTITYTYTGSLLILITDGSLQQTHLDYTGNDLTQIRVVSDGQTQTITRYSYDTDHRLTQVQVDLSPDDNSVTDNDVYTTTYTYDGTSRRIASITQSDGSSVEFTYQLIDGAHRVRTYTDGAGRVTTLTYTQPSVTGTGGSQSSPANGAVLSTTDTPTTTTNHSLDTGAVATTDVQTNIHDLNTAALVGAVNSSPVVQTYLNAATQVIGTLHADGSFTSYRYTVHGQLENATRHDAAPVSPLWSQDFGTNADGFQPLHAGFMTHENGALTVSTRGDLTEGWHMSFGTRTHDFDDHVVFRAEVTTGTGDSSLRRFNIGAENPAETRRHSAFFFNDQVRVSYYDGGWQQDTVLGSIADNTTYVVEVVTHAQGSTLYVFAKGSDRDAGYRHDLAFTDWGTARSFFETYGETGYGTSSVRLDNVSEASTSGALVGPWIAAESAQDLRVYYDDGGRVSGTLQNGSFTTYSYDALGQLVSTRRHDGAPLVPIWSQDFSHDAGGFVQLYPGLNTHENGGLTVSTGFDPFPDWRVSRGQQIFDFDDHLVYRGEVTTASNSPPREFSFGIVNQANTRSHTALFRDGHVYAEYLDQGVHDIDLGLVDDDTTYVVEVATDASGTTLYVYEKGTDRASGYSHHLSSTDWLDARLVFDTHAGPDDGVASVRLDNISVATSFGPLIGSLIAPESAQDVVTTVGDPDWQRRRTIDVDAAPQFQQMAFLRTGFDAAGNGFAVYSKGLNLFVSRYLAATDTWSAGTQLNIPPEVVPIGAYHVAVDDAGHAVIAYNTAGSAPEEIAVKVTWFDPLSGAWSTPVAISATHETGFLLGLSIEGDTTALVWDHVEVEGSGPTAEFTDNIVVAVLIDGTLDNSQLLATYPGGFEGSTAPGIAVDASGDAVFSFGDQSAGEIRTWHYSASTSTWTEDAAVSVDDPLPGLAVNGNLDGVLLWTTDEQVFVQRATAGGAWGTAVALSVPVVGTTVGEQPSVAIDDDGNILAAWREFVEPDGDVRLASRRYDAVTATWSAATYSDFEVEGPIIHFVDLNCSIEGEHATITWLELDLSTNGSHLYGMKLIDETWTEPQQLDTGGVPTSFFTPTAGGITAWAELNANGSMSMYAHRFSYDPLAYTIPSGATWQSIANTLYGVNSAEAGAALQAVLGNPPLTAGNQLTDLPLQLSVTSPITVPAYFTIPSGATWQSIANTLYGADSVEGGEALRAAMNDPPLTAGTRLTNLPATLSVTTPDTLTYELDTGEITNPASTWAAAALLETSSSSSASPRIAFDANGDGFAIWRSGGNLFARRYVRSTDTWESQVTLDAQATTVSSPALAVDAAGNAIAAWVQSDGTAVSTYTSFYDASTGLWGAATPVDGSSNPVVTTDGLLSVAINGDHAAVAWPFQNGDVHVARLVNGTWANAESIESSSNVASRPNVVIDASGNVLTIWRQPEPSVQSTLYNRYDAAAGTWSGPQLLENSATATDRPLLTIDDTGHAMALWQQGTNIIARRYDFATATWATAQTIHVGTGPIEATRISADSAGNAVAIWQQSDGTADSIWASTYDVATATWAASQVLDASNQPVADDFLSMDAIMRAGRAVVTWVQFDGTRNDVYASHFSAGTWSAPDLIESNDNDAMLPVVALDVDGYATVSWLQSDGTANSIYQARLTPSQPYFLVPSGATWQSVANTLYGVNSAQAGAALQALLGDPPLTTDAHLTGVPAQLVLPIIITVPAYYTVQNGDTWATITDTIYGTDDPAAIEALQDALGNPTLSTGLKLTVPMTLTYGEGGASTLYLQTDVEDALGNVTTYEQDEEGRLTAVLSPTVGGSRLETNYAYDADGNVTSIAQDPNGLNRVTALSYDANGNLLSSRDDLGNTITRTYNSNNQLLTETRYLVPDPDGGGSGQPSVPLTTRYAYDADNHLRFAISADGRVTEHQYNAAGERTLTLKYTGGLYTATNFAEGDLVTWASAQDLERLERVDYAYDWRGNVSALTAFASTNSSGAGTGSASITRFIYDQRGRLLQTIDARDNTTALDEDNENLPYATTYTYDGLGRVLTSTQWVKDGDLATTVNDYDDANRRTTTTLENGLVTTLLYNQAGELISVANGTETTPAELGTTTYTYDAGGRLRIVTDPLGTRAFHLYDDAGRKIGIVDGDGSLTELVYDRANQPIKTIRYAELLNSTALQSLVDTNGDPLDVPFADLRAAADGNPDHDRITRSVYDEGGQLLMTIDESGAVTKLIRDGAGRITEEVRYATTVTIARTVDQVLEGDLTITISTDDRQVRRFYDKDSNLAAVVDAEGYLTDFMYDSAGHLTQQIAYATQTSGAGTLAQLRPAPDSDDIVSYFFHDGQGRRIGALDGEGYFTETVYDVAGHVTQNVRYDRQLTYTPGTSDFQSLKADATAAPAPDIHTHLYEYDGAGRVVEETDFEGTITTYVYNDVGNLISSTRAADTTQVRTIQKRYDRLGRVSQELTAQGHALITGGMTEAQINDIWDRYGITYAYDNAGRRISATVRPDDTQTNKTRYFYDRDGRLRFEVNERGEVKENRYDALGQLTESIAYANPIAVSGLDGGSVSTTLTDRVTVAADAEKDAHTVLTYTTRGQVSSTTTGEAANTTYTYNTFGEQSGSLQALTGTTSLEHEYFYDKRGLLTNTRWDPDGLDTTEDREYDAFGRLTHLTDANGNLRRIEYDRLGRTIVTVDALNAERFTTYDAFSRILTTSDALENVTEYAYDDAARSMTMTTPEGIAVTTTHNRHGQTLTVVAAGLTTQYSYDPNGQLTGVSDNLGTLENRTYDRAGRQLTSTDARGTTTTFEYDAANRVIARTVDDGDLALTTQYLYDGQGKVTMVTDPNGHETQTIYDADGRVIEVVVDPSFLQLRTTYEYDLGGRLITVTEGAGTPEQRVVENEYDALGRRIREVVDPEGLELQKFYSYDETGNLIRKREGSFETLYVYDAENRQRFIIDTYGGVTETLYDANGRVTATKRWSQSIGAGEFPEEGPVSIAQVLAAPRYPDDLAQPPDRIERYVYDGDGRHVFTIDAMGGTTRKEYDERGNVIRQVMYSQRIEVDEVYDTVQDVEAALDAVEDNDVSNDRESRTVYDLRGRARYAIDGLGGVVAYTYDAAGNVVSKTEYATPYAGSTATLVALDGFATNVGGSSDRTTRMWYDAANRLRFTVDAENYLREKRYDDVGRVTAEILYDEKLTTIASAATLEDLELAAAGVADVDRDQRTDTIYDAAGRATSVADASGSADTYEYDAVGNRISFTNKAGATWTYVYDANRRLIEEHSPVVEIVTVTTSNGEGGYGDQTDLTSSTSTGSIITRMEYDSLGNVISRTEAYGRSNERTTYYEYDALGKQILVQFPEVGNFDNSFWTGYGGELHRIQIEDPFSAVSSTTYDTLGNAIVNQDVRGGFTQRIYDVLGRVRYVIDAEGYVTEHRYDTFGNQVEMIRYANRFEEDPAEVISEEIAAALFDPDTAVDRVIQTQYDRLNRAVQVTQPETLVFLPSAGQSGGQLISASPTTLNEYNAQGQLQRQSQLVDPIANAWATTYFYYDERGQKTAQIDALGYVTTFEYDAAGNEIRKVEYARALIAGSWNLAGHAAPLITTPATSPDDPAGYDRITECVYDRLNRKVSDRQVGVVTSATPTGADHVTTFDYDAVGNRTRVTTNGVATYMYYDVLGRQTAIAAPERNLGDGTFLTPLTRMRRDAFGNLVEQIVYANGADTATLNELTFTPVAADQRTRFLVDAMNRVTQTMDEEGNKRFASYYVSGELALEWQHPVVSQFVTPWERIQTRYEYDLLGRQTFSQQRRVAGESSNDRAAIVEYNAFGEIVSRHPQFGNSEDYEHFDYDQAGRLWRTNADDGVWKVYLYDLAGRATAEIRSRELNLSSMDLQGITELQAQRMRTETRYDLLGRVVEQRLPSFAPANPDGELEVIGAQFEIDDDVQAPSNPDAVYRLINEEINFGFDTFGYTLPMLDPGATVAQGGGYYFVTPTSGNPNAGWAQDTSYHLVTGRYLHWARPDELWFGIAQQSISMAFEYRAQGDPNGAWTTLQVVSLPDGEVGVALGSLPDGEYDYRVSYTRATQLQPYAIATGTIDLDGSTTSTVDTTLATLAAENITPTSITTMVPVNTEFLDAHLRIGSFSGMNALDGFVYKRVESGSLVSYVVDREATVAEGGGYYLTATGYVQKPDYTPELSRSIRWDPPADEDLVPRFEYWSASQGQWLELAVATIDTGPTTVEYAVAIGTFLDGQFDFRITYLADGSTDPVATATGTFRIEATDAVGTLQVEADPPDNAGTVAPVSNRPGGSNDVEAVIISSSGHDAISSEGVVFTGTNEVLVSFPSFAGAVRVELEYLTRPIDPEDDPGPNEEGWPAETRRISLLLTDASAAADGLQLIWNDPSAPSTGGGISEITRILVYSIAGDDTATLRAASDDAGAATIGGASLSWDAPWNTNIDATFNVRRVGETGWQALTVNRVGGDYSVDLQSIGAGEWEYEIIYEQDGVLRAQTQGTFVSSGGAISNVFEDPGSSPFPIEPVAPVSGIVTSPVEFDLADSAEQIVTGIVPNQPLATAWDGLNEIDLTWADLGTGPVRVVVDYISAPRYSYNYTSSQWEQTAAYVPGVRTSHTQEFASGATGATVSWSDPPGDVGGVQSIQRIRVYTQPNGNWVLKYDRDAAAPIGGTSVSWPTPDNEDVDAAFRIREVGSTTWETISVGTSSDGLQFADLSLLADGDYEYEISHSITEGSVTTVVALTTGELTVTASSSITPRTRSLDVTQHNATFDRGENDFGPVSWDGEEIAWSLAPQSGDTILVRTRVVGATTWTEQTISGSGPDFVADATVVGSQALEFEILYTQSGQTTPYSAARGTLNSTVTSNRVPAVVTVTTQTALQQTSIPPVDVTNDIGVITWTTPADSTSDITFRYQLTNGTWQTLDVIGDEEEGYRVDHVGLPDGVYRYEVIYKRPTETLPYAIASGAMTVGGSPDGGGMVLESHTVYSVPTTQSTTANVPTRVQTFDRWGNLLTATDVLGNTTEYRYDQMGHVIRSEQPTVAVVDTRTGVPVETSEAPLLENMYDLNGRLVATRDANGNVNSVTYNEAGQIIAETHADGGVKQFVYDAFGNQVLVTDELAFRTRNTYDGVNRLVKVERELTSNGLGSPTTSVTYTYQYDSANRRVAESDGISLTSYEYDEAGNLTARFSPRGFETQYSYDRNGNKTFETDANGLTQRWRYDEFDRLLEHEDLGGTITRYEYDHGGLLVRQTSTLGQNLEFQYDTAGHLLRIVDRGVADTNADVVSSNRVTEYGYDLAGRRIVERTTVDNVVHQDSRISYDALGRMVQVQDPDFTVNYSYDAAGNRTHIAAEYFNHNGTTVSDEQSQDLWYTYDEMNRVLVTQGVFSNGVIDITTAQGSELAYNLRGERISARTAGEYMRLREEVDLEFGTQIEYTKHQGLFTERYGYDGLGRLIWTEQDTPTTFIGPTGNVSQFISNVRTNTRHYDAASRETLNETFAIDGNGPVSSLTLTARASSYDADGRLTLQETRKNNIVQFRVRYGDMVFVPEQIVPIAAPVVRSYLTARSGGSSSGGGSLGKVARTLVGTAVLTWHARRTGLPTGYVRVPAHWEGTGFDKAGVLHSYKVEVHKPETGKYLYATEHKLTYRKGDGYQLIKETADSFTTVHNIALPKHGETTRTYNVNGELVQYSDKEAPQKNRYFVNDAQGKALLVTTGNFNGREGNSTWLQAIAQGVNRIGNTSGAQYFFSANGQSIGSFGQLTNEEGDFEANFDVNFTPVSEQFPAATPSQVIVQAGDTLRGIAARVFGDASLWYVIAEENGLSDPDAALAEGTLLRIPNQVLSLSNDAFSFKPFDVSDAIGDANPTQPAPKKKKKHGGLRGLITTVLIIIVAVVVTVFLTPYATAALGSNFLGAAAAAGVGSAASQGVAIGLGVQDEFSWKQVGAAALTAGIIKGTPVGELAGAVTTEPLANSVLQGALNSAVAQGVNIAVGLQDSFSWRNVAIASASSGAATATGNWGQQQTLSSTNSTFLQQVGANAIAGAGSVLVRTAFGGKVDATSVLADIFGNALGSSIADRIAPVSQSTLDAGIQSGIEQTLARNEAELLGMPMPTLTTEEDVRRQRLQMSVEQDIRQELFQASVQRDIELSLTSNPAFAMGLPMPRARFDMPSVSPSTAVSGGPNAADPRDFFSIMREAQRTGRTMDEVGLAYGIHPLAKVVSSPPETPRRLEQVFGMLGIPQSVAGAIRSIEERGLLGAIHHTQDNPTLERTQAWMMGNAKAMSDRADSYSDANPLGVMLRADASDAAVTAGGVMTNNFDVVLEALSFLPISSAPRAVRAATVARNTEVALSEARAAESLIFYHGTSAEIASDIRIKGIDLTKGSEFSDFGQGFYMTTSREEALASAGRLYGDEPLDVVSFNVPGADLSNLSSLRFGAADADWQDFVKFHKKYGPSDLLHGGQPYDLVQGPLFGRSSGLEKVPVPRIDRPAGQTSIHTPTAVELFDRYMMRE